MLNAQALHMIPMRHNQMKNPLVPLFFVPFMTLLVPLDNHVNQPSVSLEALLNALRVLGEGLRIALVFVEVVDTSKVLCDEVGLRVEVGPPDHELGQMVPGVEPL